MRVNGSPSLSVLSKLWQLGLLAVQTWLITQQHHLLLQEETGMGTPFLEAEVSSAGGGQQGYCSNHAADAASRSCTSGGALEHVSRRGRAGAGEGGANRRTRRIGAVDTVEANRPEVSHRMLVASCCELSMRFDAGAHLQYLFSA